MKKLTLTQITEKIKAKKFQKFDLIVAIGKDGIMPASLLKHFLDIPVEVIWLNYRNKENKPIREEPILKKPLNKRLKLMKNKNILIVDSISKTGKTLEKAKEVLKDNRVKTFVINGKADYSLFKFKECIDWPW
jgi:hypoxanthine phosphoribosyltransferase